MPYLVVSDLHLTLKTPKKKIVFLESLFNKYNKILIIGDLFEGYENSPKKVYVKYKKLFELLDQKDCTFLRGNHDKETKFPFFSKVKYIEGDYFIRKIYGKKYAFAHGHLIVKSIDVKLYLHLLPRFLTRLLLVYYKNFTNRLEPKLEVLHPDVAYLKAINLKIMEGIYKKIAKVDHIIFGHTHYRESNKIYSNPGFIGKNQASYIVISEKGVQPYTCKY